MVGIGACAADMPSPRSVEVYRNLTRKAWSVRVNGRVVAHVQAIALQAVTLRASEAGRLRCLRTGARDVHAWARGTEAEEPRPPGAIRLRYRLEEPGFRAGGSVITAASAAWFEADGSAWIEGGGDEGLDFQRRSRRCDAVDAAGRPAL
ncbi:hypothetical protein Maq22A_1p34585 (plasmid) [Methylobacterium aquaticum]|uniref:Uncharacterized protein n=1 Tax=Methylobacterium aquaticum TaxID=270351 RepID=A0A0C6F8R1_9HYPH|nr:hypothetical protein Maq22A_1p34585 [Methylobacterium aquaticum]